LVRVAAGAAPTRFSFGESLSEAYSKGALEFTTITEMIDETATDAGRNLRAYCGEGGFGGDGFVALCWADTDKPIWIAFFETSNPFVSVSLHANCVVAQTTLDRKWTFPLEEPEKFAVE